MRNRQVAVSALDTGVGLRGRYGAIVSLAFVALISAGSSLGQESPGLRFLSPPAGAAAFGDTPVHVEITGNNNNDTRTQPTVRWLRLEVDGRPAGLAEDLALGSTVSFRADFGEENLSHLVVAEAELADGRRLRRELRLPRLQVDELLDLDLRQVYVTVSRRGRLFRGLEREAFSLFEADRSQEIVTFEDGGVPFTAVLLLDGSLSMQGAPLDQARSGALAFVRGMQEHDEASVTIFADRLRAVSPFRLEADVLSRRLQQVDAGGGSALYDSLYQSLRRLEERQGRRVVVILSDGEDVHSVLQPKDVALALYRSQAQLFWVNPAQARRGHHGVDSWVSPKDRQDQRKEMEKMVQQSGGRAITLSDYSELESTFLRILEELHGQYALGYYPTSTEASAGTFRPWKLEIRGPRGLEARTPAGFYVQ